MELSIVLPAYRASREIGETIERLRPLLDQFAPAEVLVVDDGSGDDTAEVALTAARAAGYRIDDEAGEAPRFEVIRMPENRGKGRAVRVGMQRATGRARLFSDVDLWAGLEGVRAVAQAVRDGAAVAVASRFIRGSSFLMPAEQFASLMRRHAASRTLNRIVRLLFGVRTHDTQAGLKGFRDDVADAVFDSLFIERFGIDVELFALFAATRVPVVEVPVRYHFGGASSVSLLRDGLRVLRDLVGLRWRLWTGAYTRPKAALRACLEQRPGMRAGPIAVAEEPPAGPTRSAT